MVAPRADLNFDIAAEHGLTGEDIAVVEFLACQHIAEVIEWLDLSAYQLASAGPTAPNAAVVWPVDPVLEGNLEQVLGGFTHDGDALSQRQYLGGKRPLIFFEKAKHRERLCV